MAYYSDREAHAFLWDGHMTDLGALHDFAASWGVAVNARGDVIGQSSPSADNPEHSRPFLWRRGVLSALREPAPYAPDLSVNAVNNSGHVVGNYVRHFPSNAQVAVVWQDSVMWELGQSSTATAINQQGDVVGSANGRAALGAGPIHQPPRRSWPRVAEFTKRAGRYACARLSACLGRFNLPTPGRRSRAPTSV